MCCRKVQTPQVPTAGGFRTLRFGVSCVALAHRTPSCSPTRTAVQPVRSGSDAFAATAAHWAAATRRLHAAAVARTLACALHVDSWSPVHGARLAVPGATRVGRQCHVTSAQPLLAAAQACSPAKRAVAACALACHCCVRHPALAEFEDMAVCAEMWLLAHNVAALARGRLASFDALVGWQGAEGTSIALEQPLTRLTARARCHSSLAPCMQIDAGTQAVQAWQTVLQAWATPAALLLVVAASQPCMRPHCSEADMAPGLRLSTGVQASCKQQPAWQRRRQRVQTEPVLQPARADGPCHSAFKCLRVCQWRSLLPSMYVRWQMTSGPCTVPLCILHKFAEPHTCAVLSCAHPAWCGCIACQSCAAQCR